MPRDPSYSEVPDHQPARDTSPEAPIAMTQKVEAAAPEIAPQAPRQSADLLGPAYLVIIATVMTAWIGGLVWAALAVFNWLTS